MRFIKSLLRKTDIQTSHHSNHTIPPIENLIIQLSNHHTKIIPKSIELRNICMCVCVCECSLSFSLTRSFQKCNEQNFSRYFQVCHTQKMFYFYFDAVYTYMYIYVCVLLQLHDRSDRREPIYLRLQLFVQLVVFFVFIFDHL